MTEKLINMELCDVVDNAKRYVKRMEKCQIQNPTIHKLIVAGVRAHDIRCLLNVRSWTVNAFIKGTQRPTDAEQEQLEQLLSAVEGMQPGLREIAAQELKEKAARATKKAAKEQSAKNQAEYQSKEPTWFATCPVAKDFNPLSVPSSTQTVVETPTVEEEQYVEPTEMPSLTFEDRDDDDDECSIVNDEMESFVRFEELSHGAM
ncbi:MAG: hypothetical protein HQL50_07360 [Magnetococcales bacterium]|nr:hypothetical protein [Magnetococcales bacterium]